MANLMTHPSFAHMDAPIDHLAGNLSARRASTTKEKQQSARPGSPLPEKDDPLGRFRPRRHTITKSSVIPAEFPDQLFTRYQLKTSGTLKRTPAIEVQGGKNKSTGREVVIKIISKDCLDLSELTLKQHLKVLKKVKHANIVPLIDVFECEAKIYMVCEFISRDSLSDRLQCSNNQNGVLELQACVIFSKLLSAVGCLHDLNVVHGEVQPDNILFADSGFLNLKLTDFGVTRFLTQQNASDYQYAFTAPEALLSRNRTFERSAAEDVWSLGVLLYVMLCGELPFASCNPDDKVVVLENIQKGSFDFAQPTWSQVSDDAKHLVQHILVVDIGTRYTIENCEEHVWVEEYTGVESKRVPSWYNRISVPRQVLDHGGLPSSPLAHGVSQSPPNWSRSCSHSSFPRSFSSSSSPIGVGSSMSSSPPLASLCKGEGGIKGLQVQHNMVMLNPHQSSVSQRGANPRKVRKQKNEKDALLALQGTEYTEDSV